jgi:hypothetical protein
LLVKAATGIAPREATILGKHAWRPRYCRDTRRWTRKKSRVTTPQNVAVERRLGHEHVITHRTTNAQSAHTPRAANSTTITRSTSHLETYRCGWASMCNVGSFTSQSEYCWAPLDSDSPTQGKANALEMSHRACCSADMCSRLTRVDVHTLFYWADCPLAYDQKTGVPFHILASRRKKCVSFPCTPTLQPMFTVHCDRAGFTRAERATMPCNGGPDIEHHLC